MFRPLQILAVAFLAFPAYALEVDLGYAKYQSYVTLVDGVISFLGIRYASAPTGNLRWRAPTQPPSAPGIQQATLYGPQCFQGNIRGNPGTSLTSPYRGLLPNTTSRRSLQDKLYRRHFDGISDEDCLFLNVHVPIHQNQHLLPVIVYIHGGGYDAGNTSVYPAQVWVNWSDSNLIVVNIQYRLGVFGFLSSQDVKDNGNLNAGLLDQNFALQWVQKYISAFGGNPSKYHYNDSILETAYSGVVDAVNCTSSRDTMACLRSANATSLFAADVTVGSEIFLQVYTFVPVVDETFIMELPTVTLTRGRVNGNTLIVSSNVNEGGLFVPSDVIIANNLTFTQYVTGLFPRFNRQQIEQAVTMYSNLSLDSVSDQAAAIMGDVIFICPAYYTLSAFGKSEKRAFKALFAIPPALHADDLSYEFPGFIIPPTYTNPEFQNAFMQSFLFTAGSLDPNIHFPCIETITPRWPSYSDSQTEMLFNKTASNAPLIQTFKTSTALANRCLFWLSMSEINSQ